MGTAPIPKQKQAQLPGTAAQADSLPKALEANTNRGSKVHVVDLIFLDQAASVQLPTHKVKEASASPMIVWELERGPPTTAPPPAPPAQMEMSFDSLLPPRILSPCALVTDPMFLEATGCEARKLSSARLVAHAISHEASQETEESGLSPTTTQDSGVVVQPIGVLRASQCSSCHPGCHP